MYACGLDARGSPSGDDNIGGGEGVTSKVEVVPPADPLVRSDELDFFSSLLLGLNMLKRPEDLLCPSLVGLLSFFFFFFLVWLIASVVAPHELWLERRPPGIVVVKIRGLVFFNVRPWSIPLIIYCCMLECTVLWVQPKVIW